MDTSDQVIPKSHQQRAEQRSSLSTTVKASSLNALNAFNDHHQYQVRMGTDTRTLIYELLNEKHISWEIKRGGG
jgi:hypothetical protein